MLLTLSASARTILDEYLRDFRSQTVMKRRFRRTRWQG